MDKLEITNKKVPNPSLEKEKPASLPVLSADLLNGLSDEERKLALNILEEMAKEGSSETFSKLIYEDYEEIPVTIDEFVDNEMYLRNAFYDAEGHCKLYPFWRTTLHKLFPDNIHTSVNNFIESGARGLGKAQPLSTPVLTENGFKPMGSLTLEDRVYGRDGKLHRILGIFPQGKKKICRVSFTDKTSTLCCEDHLWRVHHLADSL